MISPRNRLATRHPMRPHPRPILHLILVAVLVAPWHVAAAPGETIIRDVTVITGDGTPPLPGRTVVVRDGMIAAVHDGRLPTVPEDALILEGRGRHLLPGFIDTHAHLAMGPVRVQVDGGVPVMAMQPLETVGKATANALLAYGVTTARDPGGKAELTVALRDRIAGGALAGPTFQVAGEVIDTSRFDNLAATVSTVADVRREVARQAQIGVDWIKLYVGLSPAMVEAAIDEAHRRGLRVTGHLQATTWAEAAAMGLDSIVHALPGSAELLPEASRADYLASMTSLLYMLRWFALVDVESPAMQHVSRSLREHHVSVDPTLIVFHSMAHGNQPAYTGNPALHLVPPALVENWRTSFNFNVGWKPDDFIEARRLYPQAAAFVRWLHEQGVMLSAGTDANNPWIVPGDSYHTELELLHEAGIPALDVVTIATRNGARTLGVATETGTVEAGKRADLVLLQSDPLADIRATRELVWVMKGGALHEPAATPL